jgi:SPP1 family predicted phage head-tail adaptor
MKTILQANTPVIQIGKLRHRIQILQPNPVQDTAGGFTLGNSTVVKTVWATVESLSGQEKFLARQFESSVTHAIYVRYDKQFKYSQEMQIGYDGRTFQIEAILNPDERHKVLQLLCVELNESVGQTPTAPESTL